jgi:hypothetical protein
VRSGGREVEIPRLMCAVWFFMGFQVFLVSFREFSERRG